MRSMFGGRGAGRSPSRPRRRALTSSCASAGLKRRSKPIVVDAFELIALPAERAGDVTRVDLDAVAELDEPPERVEEPLGALARLDGEVGPRGVADEQRVAGQDEPRLRPAREVADGEAAVLRPVPRRVDAAEDDVAERRSRRRPPAASCGYSASAAGWMLTGRSCSSASRPWPERWSACVCVSTTRTRRTPRRSASSRYCSIANAGSTTTASPVRRRRRGTTHTRARRRRTA